MLNSFCSSILLQLESLSFCECWVLSRWRNTRIQASHIQYPVRSCCFDIVQTSRSRGQHFCSKFAKIPHLGCPRTFKVPTPTCFPPPPSGITLIAALVTPSEIVSSVTTSLFDLIWCKKTDKIKRQVIHQDYVDGG